MASVGGAVLHQTARTRGERVEQLLTGDVVFRRSLDD